MTKPPFELPLRKIPGIADRFDILDRSGYVIVGGVTEYVADTFITAVNEHERLRERVAKLEAGLRSMFDLIENGILVRDMSHDHEQGLALRQIKLVRVLSDAHALLAEVKPSEGAV